MARKVTLPEFRPIDLGKFDSARAVCLSDLHLREETSPLSARVSDFIAGLDATHLFLLGDIFDFWLGDEHRHAPSHKQILAALQECTRNGVAVVTVRGNRDLLLQDFLLHQIGATAGGSAVTISVRGRRALLTHGDIPCTWDSRYGAWRRLCSAQAFCRIVKQIPLAIGRRIGRLTRLGSQIEVSFKPNCSIDDLYSSLELVFADGIDVVIAGHIHDVGMRSADMFGRTKELFILGGTERGGSYLEIQGGNFTIKQLM